MNYASFFGGLFDLALIWVWFFLGIFLAVQVAVVGLRPVRLGFWGVVSAVALFTLVGMGFVAVALTAGQVESPGVVFAIGGMGAVAVAGIWRMALQEYLTVLYYPRSASLFLCYRRRDKESDDDAEDAS